jgi:ferredoxin, 2Fe-2S
VPRIFVTDRDGERFDVDAPVGQALMFTLRDGEGLPVEGLCGGSAACGTCHVFIDADWVERLKPREDDEMQMLESLAHFDRQRSRLSCQIKPTPDLDGLSLRLAPEE